MVNITLGSILQFMAQNIIPMIFFCIAVVALLRSNQAIKQDNIKSQTLTNACFYGNLWNRFYEIMLRERFTDRGQFGITEKDLKQNFTKEEWVFMNNYDLRKDIGTLPKTEYPPELKEKINKLIKEYEKI